MTATQAIKYIRQHRAHNVLSVIRVVGNNGCEYRGKINLGMAALGNRRNSWLARPVETACSLGLLSEHQEGRALCYHLTWLGVEVLNEFDGNLTPSDISSQTCGCPVDLDKVAAILQRSEVK